MNPSPRSEPYLSTVTPEPSTRPIMEVDLELVRRMQSGDERALGAFYDRWFPVVSSLLSRILKSADDVEDVIEETFWQAWRQADRFSAERGSVQTWLLTIARSRGLDRLRSTRRLREESIEDGTLDAGGGASTATLVRSASDPSLDVEHAERKTLVVAALAELPREQREALELGYFAGLSQSEIAEHTGQPLGTIKTRMRMAMLKLRERLSLLREDAR
jgi:RNA polymerase sigma-70 factor (ECF subfamily)